MKVAGADKLLVFQKKHPEAKAALASFQRVLDSCPAKNFAELKQTFRTVDYVKPYCVFDVGGNKYRIIVLVTFAAGVATIQKVMTHADYDHWKP